MYVAYKHASVHMYVHRQLGKIPSQGFAVVDRQESHRELMCQGRSAKLRLYSWSPMNYAALGK